MHQSKKYYTNQRNQKQECVECVCFTPFILVQKEAKYIHNDKSQNSQDSHKSE